MFKLISTGAAVMALAGTLFGAVATGPADASLLPGPCQRYGPSITVTADHSSVLGSCFGPGAYVDVEFWSAAGGQYSWSRTEGVRASFDGTFTVAMPPYPDTWATEYLIATQGSRQSNLITLPAVVAQ
ncbi:MAG: hypothetical protein JO027_04830 [Solirubrobacterales bacterium]|nr:hypothetical protein [Solirubrobacterales bacterium]